MRHRPLFVVAGSLAATLVAASAFALGGGPDPEPVPLAAAQDDNPSSDDLGLTGDDVPDVPSPNDSPSPADTPAVAAGSETYRVADAGTVTVSTTPDGLVVTAVADAAGWSGHVDAARGREVEVTFRSGEARVDFRAEIEDGGVRIRVRDRRIEDLEDARRDEEDAQDEDRSGPSDADDDRDDSDDTDDD